MPPTDVATHGSLGLVCPLIQLTHATRMVRAPTGSQAPGAQIDSQTITFFHSNSKVCSMEYMASSPVV